MAYTVREFASLPSTNAYAADNAGELRHGDVVAARVQTEGRGRHGRKWLSEEGGLYFSVCLEPVPAVSFADMEQLLCLAICRAIKGTGVNAVMRWPNDILVRGAKIAGVFGECARKKNGTPLFILGAGVNLNQEKPKIPGKTTTTLAREGVTATEMRFLETILRLFSEACEQVTTRGFAASPKEYVRKFTLLGEEICVEARAGKPRGTFLWVPPAGRMVLGLEDPPVRQVRVGDMA